MGAWGMGPEGTTEGQLQARRDTNQPGAGVFPFSVSQLFKRKVQRLDRAGIVIRFYWRNETRLASAKSP